MLQIHHKAARLFSFPSCWKVILLFDLLKWLSVCQVFFTRSSLGFCHWNLHSDRRSTEKCFVIRDLSPVESSFAICASLLILSTRWRYYKENLSFPVGKESQPEDSALVFLLNACTFFGRQNWISHGMVNSLPDAKVSPIKRFNSLWYKIEIKKSLLFFLLSFNPKTWTHMHTRISAKLSLGKRGQSLTKPAGSLSCLAQGWRAKVIPSLWIKVVGELCNSALPLPAPPLIQAWDNLGLKSYCTFWKNMPGLAVS